MTVSFASQFNQLNVTQWHDSRLCRAIQQRRHLSAKGTTQARDHAKDECPNKSGQPDGGIDLWVSQYWRQLKKLAEHAAQVDNDNAGQASLSWMIFVLNAEKFTLGMTAKNLPTASRQSNTKSDETIDASWVRPPADSWHEVRDNDDVDVIVPKTDPSALPVPMARASCNGSIG